MALIIVQEHEKGENFERATKRFFKKVGEEGIIREYKKHTFFTGPSEAKRIKRREAQKRRRKTEARTRKFRPNPDAKVIPFFPDTEWPVNLKTQRRKRIFTSERPFFKGHGTSLEDVFSNEAVAEMVTGQGPAEMAGFGEDQRRQIEEVEGTLEIPSKTAYTAGIIEYNLPGFGPGLVIVRNKNKGDGPEVLFCFPGGEVKLKEGETPEEGVVRETEEETGLQSKIDGLVWSMNDGPFHEKKIFRLVHSGGTPKIGEEIAELRLASMDGMEELCKNGLFKKDHMLAFYEYRKIYLDAKLLERGAQESQEGVKNV